MTDMNKRQLERIHARYGKPLKHHGDCYIYQVNLPVCTCGLMHDLMPLDINVQKMRYPGIEKDWVTETAWLKACQKQFLQEDGLE